MHKFIEKFFNLPRWFLMTIALCFLFWGGYYGAQQSADEYDTSKEIFQQPGEAICVGYTKIISITRNEIITIDRVGDTYRLITTDTKLRIGEIYSFSGMVTDSGKIQLYTYQHHPFRGLKYVFSLLSMIIIIFLILKYIRYDRATFSLVVKD